MRASTLCRFHSLIGTHNLRRALIACVRVPRKMRADIIETGSGFGRAVRRWAGKQRDFGSNPLGLSLLSKVVVCGHCLVTLSLIINETLKWLSSLPILTQ